MLQLSKFLVRKFSIRREISRSPSILDLDDKFPSLSRCNCVLILSRLWHLTWPINFQTCLTLRLLMSYMWAACGRSPADIVGSNPTGGHGYLSVVSVVCCQRSLRRADHSSRGVLPTVLRRCVWSRNIKNRCSIYIYIYIYDISSLKVNDLTLILLTWRKRWTNNPRK